MSYHIARYPATLNTRSPDMSSFIFNNCFWFMSFRIANCPVILNRRRPNIQSSSRFLLNHWVPLNNKRFWNSCYIDIDKWSLKWKRTNDNHNKTQILPHRNCCINTPGINMASTSWTMTMATFYRRLKYNISIIQIEYRTPGSYKASSRLVDNPSKP